VKEEIPTLLGPFERVNFNLWTCLALSKGPNRVCVSLPSPEDGNRSSFRNGISLEFRTMDKVKKPSDADHKLLFELN
jgi:hypothetical protein